MIEVICDVELEFPYENSRNTVHRLSLIKKIRIIQSFRNATIMRLGIPIDLFEQWYEIEPELGLYPPPKGADSFMHSLRVRQIAYP